jgi:alpha-beta hydrolase superfamily lysophospholipase
MAVERIRTHDGLSLVVEHREVAGARARLVIVHGYAEHRGRYTKLADQLEARGIECHLFDLRGHGTSEGPRAHVPRFADYLDDLDRVVSSVRACGGTAPLLLLAHSLGGLIALAYVRQHPGAFDALAVSSPFLGPAFRVPRIRAMLARVLSRVTPRLLLPNGLNPRWVSRDEAVVAAYVADPLIFSTTTPRWFMEITAAQRALIAHSEEIKTPALFLLARSDRIADHKIALDVFARLGTSDKQLRTYPELYHEVFNELSPAHEVVIGDLLAWIDSGLARTLHDAVSSGGLHE